MKESNSKTAEAMQRRIDTLEAALREIKDMSVQDIICRRLRKDRITPTDAHAIAFPRHPCWVKAYDGSDWEKAQLLAVGGEWLECRYLVRYKDGSHGSCKQCLIEAVEEV